MGPSASNGGTIMKRNMPFFISLILVLPQCANIRPKKTFEPIQTQSKNRINVAPEWLDKQDMYFAPLIHDQNITMQEAIAFGLQNNPGIQVHFEEIGIRKADLVQAGFYSNPHVESIFRIPKKDGQQTNIEVSVNFMLSDLWQVPFRKRVAQGNLEIKTHEVISEILQLRKQIQLSYLNCQYKKEYLALIKEITAVIQDIKERIDYRYQFGYNSKLDRYFALSKLAEWQAKIIDAQAKLDTAYISLQEILGAPISTNELNLTDPLSISDLTITQEELELFAISSHPYILIEQAKITKAKSEISYEKSRIIDNVQVGISYERDFEKLTSGVGPSFGINIPLFDTNYGNIERAEFDMAQAEKTLVAQKRMVFKNISNQYALYNAYIKQIRHYNQLVIPPAMKAIAFSKEFFDKMQMSMIIFLETQIDLFQSKVKLLELTYQSAQEYVGLEFSAGAKLSNITI